MRLMRGTLVRCLTFLALAVLAATRCPGQDITVRAIDGRSLKPFSQKPVELDAQDFQLYPQDNSKLIATGTTGADGTVVFHLQPPLPKMLFVSVGEFGKTLPCSLVGFATEEVLRSGIVFDNRCHPKGKLKGQFTATPREVIVFATKLTFWDSFLRELP
jgi:hypothetical protein